MPVTVTYPGVYIEEVPSGVRTITGVATSITAFIGRALRGPTDRPRLVQSFAEFQRVYGGLWAESTMPYAIQQYFLNGGRDALICRVHNGAAAGHPDAAGKLRPRGRQRGQLGRAPARACGPRDAPGRAGRDAEHALQPVRQRHGNGHR